MKHKIMITGDLSNVAIFVKDPILFAKLIEHIRIINHFVEYFHL